MVGASFGPPISLPPHIAKLSQSQVTASGKNTSQVAGQERPGPAAYE